MKPFQGLTPSRTEGRVGEALGLPARSPASRDEGGQATSQTISGRVPAPYEALVLDAGGAPATTDDGRILSPVKDSPYNPLFLFSYKASNLNAFSEP